MRLPMLLLMAIGTGMLVGCDDPHSNAPANPTAFHVAADGVMGDVGGGNGYTSTHWERYTDDRTGQTIICFNNHTTVGGTSPNPSCVAEPAPTK